MVLLDIDSCSTLQPGGAAEHAGRASHAAGVPTLPQPAGVRARVDGVRQLRAQVHRRGRLPAGRGTAEDHRRSRVSRGRN